MKLKFICFHLLILFSFNLKAEITETIGYEFEDYRLIYLSSVMNMMFGDGLHETRKIRIGDMFEGGKDIRMPFPDFEIRSRPFKIDSISPQSIDQMFSPVEIFYRDIRDIASRADIDDCSIFGSKFELKKIGHPFHLSYVVSEKVGKENESAIIKRNSHEAFSDIGPQVTFSMDMAKVKSLFDHKFSFLSIDLSNDFKIINWLINKENIESYYSAEVVGFIKFLLYYQSETVRFLVKRKGTKLLKEHFQLNLRGNLKDYYKKVAPFIKDKKLFEERLNSLSISYYQARFRTVKIENYARECHKDFLREMNQFLVDDSLTNFKSRTFADYSFETFRRSGKTSDLMENVFSNDIFERQIFIEIRSLRSTIAKEKAKKKGVKPHVIYHNYPVSLSEAIDMAKRVTLEILNFHQTFQR